ncbi:TPA_asm: coat protein [ssRNA phage SRR6960799_5]|uniref:Coat protein n=1 Tax=ssRNA phage SRR6960799_5 TaxID=2786601 RepID=A0A8S5KY05_9VIRU|nr:coat protein [ssRNA phage SRR6960799_5]DAD50662.1 TPA_asm: coat protein [ssRNA phage SRR6960799_5]
MSNVFNPGWSWTESSRTTELPTTSLTQSSFAPKVANNSMNSFHLVQSTYGTPAYLQVKCTKVPDIYENTGVNPASQMPVKTGKRAELTFYGLGNDTITQGTLVKDYVVPIGMTLSFWMPEAYLDTDEMMNHYFSVILQEVLLGSLLHEDSTVTPAVTSVDFMQLLKGVLNLPGVLPVE